MKEITVRLTEDEADALCHAVNSHGEESIESGAYADWNEIRMARRAAGKIAVAIVRAELSDMGSTEPQIEDIPRRQSEQEPPKTEAEMWAQIDEHIKGGHLLLGIKVYRDFMDESLRDSKIAVEKRRDELEGK